MYSTIWKRASQLRGNAMPVMRPSSMWQPLAIATFAATATVAGSSRNGSTARLSASASSTVSASMISTRAPDAALMPALTASALDPPLALSTTTRSGSRTDR